MDIQGNWKLSAVKILRLHADQSFHLTKGAYHHYGSYEVLDLEEKILLRLKFETVVIDYTILNSSSTKMELMDERNQDIITARKIKPKKELVQNTYSQEEVEDKKDFSKGKDPYYKNHYRNLYPDNQYFFSIHGGGGISFASGPSTMTQQVELGNVVEDFSASYILSYGAGFKFGYQMTDGFYFGLGGTYVVSGFQANRKASTSDPEYQFDAESSQTAKYTYTSIEVPVWASYRVTDNWMFEAGFLASIPIRCTSKAVFKGDNTVMVNGEIDTRTSYTSDEYMTKYPDLLEKYALGGYAEVQRRLAKHLIFSLSYKYVKGYMEFDNELVSNNSIQANLILQLF